MDQESITTEKTKSKYKIFYIVLVFLGIFLSAFIVVGILGFSSNGRSTIPAEKKSNNPKSSSTKNTKSPSSTSSTLVSESEQETESSQTAIGNIIFSQSFGKSFEEIFSINPNDKTFCQLTEKYDENVLIDFPKFSFDCKRIIFKFKNKIYIRSLRGNDDFKLIFEAKNPDIFIFCPSFSPDGSKIIFSYETGRYGQIYIIDADKSSGSLVGNVSKEAEIFVKLENINRLIDFKYTPDGKFIVCLIRKEEEGEEEDENKTKNMVMRYYFYIIDANSKKINDKIDVKMMLSSNEIKDLLNNEEFFDITISFFSISRDSSQIIFNLILKSIYSLKNEIYIINLNGTNHRNIYETEKNVYIPRPPLWSPDGNYILFTEYLHGRNSMKILKLDSKIKEILTDSNNNPINGIALNWVEEMEKENLNDS